MTQTMNTVAKTPFSAFFKTSPTGGAAPTIPDPPVSVPPALPVPMPPPPTPPEMPAPAATLAQDTPPHAEMASEAALDAGVEGTAPAETVSAALPESGGAVFGHLSALMPVGSALAFTLSKDSAGELTVCLQPINLPALDALVLTGKVEEFDSGGFLAALRTYHAASRTSLLEQAQQRVAQPTGHSSSAAPAPKPNGGQFGTLVIEIDVPGAVVSAMLQGRAVALSPGENSVKAGRYTIEVSADGHRPSKRTVQVERGQIARAVFQLAGALHISGAGEGTVVVTNHEHQPVDPAGPLPEGLYHVAVESEGKKPFTWHGTVKAGGPPTAVTVKLDDLPPGLFNPAQ